MRTTSTTGNRGRRRTPRYRSGLVAAMCFGRICANHSTVNPVHTMSNTFGSSRPTDRFRGEGNGELGSVGQNGGGGHDERDKELPRCQPSGQLGCSALGVEHAPPVDDRDLETFHSGKQGHESERENRADNRRTLAIGGEVNRAAHPDHSQDRPTKEQDSGEGGTRCAGQATTCLRWTQTLLRWTSAGRRGRVGQDSGACVLALGANGYAGSEYGAAVAHDRAGHSSSSESRAVLASEPSEVGLRMFCAFPRSGFTAAIEPLTSRRNRRPAPSEQRGPPRQKRG